MLNEQVLYSLEFQPEFAGVGPSSNILFTAMKCQMSKKIVEFDVSSRSADN